MSDFDGQRYPFVQDLDTKWHRRPADDQWVRSLEGPNARTVCGLAVPSVHVSEYDPRVDEWQLDGDMFCECMLDITVDGGPTPRCSSTGSNPPSTVRSRADIYWASKVSAVCEGSIRCLDCDDEWMGYATAPGAAALADTLNGMLWEHHIGAPHG